MNKLSIEKKALVLRHLVEGSGIRATVRMTGVSKNTIARLLQRTGDACEFYQEKILYDLPCKLIQCDELWSFCYAKEKNLPTDFQNILDYGDAWTWIAICAETRLVPLWYTGKRTSEDAYAFILELEQLFKHKIQLTTDGYKPYIKAVDQYFDEIDFAQLVKNFQKENYKDTEPLTDKRVIFGTPDPSHVSTSYCERMNLTIRTSLRRFTRRTTGHSKKFTNHESALSLFFMYYNFARIHGTIKTTPAIAAGKADHIWTMEEIAELAA